MEIDRAEICASIFGRQLDLRCASSLNVNVALRCCLISLNMNNMNHIVEDVSIVNISGFPSVFLSVKSEFIIPIGMNWSRVLVAYFLFYSYRKSLDQRRHKNNDYFHPLHNTDGINIIGLFILLCMQRIMNWRVLRAWNNV